MSKIMDLDEFVKKCELPPDDRSLEIINSILIYNNIEIESRCTGLFTHTGKVLLIEKVPDAYDVLYYIRAESVECLIDLVNKYKNIELFI